MQNGSATRPLEDTKSLLKCVQIQVSRDSSSNWETFGYERVFLILFEWFLSAKGNLNFEMLCHDFLYFVSSCHVLVQNTLLKNHKNYPNIQFSEKFKKLWYYVYILSGQKFIKNGKTGQFWLILGKIEACSQTVLPDIIW